MACEVREQDLRLAPEPQERPIGGGCHVGMTDDGECSTSCIHESKNELRSR
jgi:hypothetical protein